MLLGVVLIALVGFGLASPLTTLAGSLGVGAGTAGGSTHPPLPLGAPGAFNPANIGGAVALMIDALGIHTHVTDGQGNHRHAVPLGGSGTPVATVPAGPRGRPGMRWFVYLGEEEAALMPEIYIQNEVGCPEPAAAATVLAALTAPGLPITSGAGAPPTTPNRPTVYTDTTTGTVYYRDASGATVLLRSPLAVLQGNYQSPQRNVSGPFPAPGIYAVQDESFTIANPDAVRTLHVLLRTSGSMFLAMSAAGTNVNSVHQLLLDGVAVGLAFEQNEVANGFESAFSGASLHLHHEIQVYAGGVNGVVSYLEYSWQGVLV